MGYHWEGGKYTNDYEYSVLGYSRKYAECGVLNKLFLWYTFLTLIARKYKKVHLLQKIYILELYTLLILLE